MKKLFYALFIMLLTSNTNFAQWQNCSPCPTCNVNSIIDFDGLLYAATNGNGIYSTPDGGTNWLQKNNGLANLNINDMVTDNTGMMYAGSNSLVIFTSADTAKNWSPHSMVDMGIAISSLAVSGSYIIAGQINDGVFISNNQGVTWTEPALCCASVLSVCVSASGKAFAGTNAVKVHAAVSPFNNWTQQSNGLPAGAVKCLYSTETLVIAGITGGGIYTTDNDGAAWVQRNNGLSNLNITALAGNDQKMFAGTNGGGIYVSVDKGLNWISANEGLTSLNITSLFVSGNYLYAGVSGNGLWKRLLSELTKIDENYKADDLLIYPMPMKDELTIQKSGFNKAKAEIFNTNGMLMMQVDLKGENTIINTATLPAGIYIVKVSDAKNTVARKVVKY